MDKILITGAAGFIGANLANKLLNSYDCFVYGIDDFSSSEITNIYPILKHNRFNFIKDDILNNDLPCCDIVYHCIGLNKLMLDCKNKYDYIYLQLKYLDKILEYSKINNSKLVILTDFDNKYEITADTIFDDYLKLQNNLIKEYGIENNLDVKIARISGVYGFSFSKKYLQTIEKIIFKAVMGLDITINNNFADYFIGCDILCSLLINLTKYKTGEMYVDITSNSLSSLNEIALFTIDYLNTKSKINVINPEIIYPKYKIDKTFLNAVEIDDSLFDYKTCLPKIIEYFKMAYLP